MKFVNIQCDCSTKGSNHDSFSQNSSVPLGFPARWEHEPEPHYQNRKESTYTKPYDNKWTRWTKANYGRSLFIPLDKFRSNIPRFISTLVVASLVGRGNRIPALHNNDGTRNVLYDRQFIPIHGSRIVSKLPTAQRAIAMCDSGKDSGSKENSSTQTPHRKGRLYTASG